ncbi:MAG: tyrosine-type recombinase/integrase [Acidobacteriia bacterium]|nr:tyrosine-type recombinase/integrase [Terriglobia bacterium]
MRKRYQTGGIKKQRGRWIGMWWVDGKRKSRVLGLVSKMSKSEARAAVSKIVAEEQGNRERNDLWRFGEFVEQVYFPFYTRKWKDSTRYNNVNRIKANLVAPFDDRELHDFRRDELQDLLDSKAKVLSFSVVDHLRWDMKQIFDMAVAEGHIERNPALLLFTPREARKPMRRVMTMKEVQICFGVLNERERLIAKLAVIAGMRPGEIFALTWGRMTASYADIRQRVYQGTIDTPKTDHSMRKAALSEGLLADIERWRMMAVVTRDDAWVFPSERMTPLRPDNCWKRHFRSHLRKVGLGWVNFLVMRRTHATLMKVLGIDGKLVADQLGHTLDVNQNIYTQTPVEIRQAAVNRLEKSLKVM